MFITIDRRNAITLRKGLSSSQEKCVLAEELGHYYYDAVYSPHCKNLQLISKQEYKANKWAYNVLIPFEDLKSAIKIGIDNLHVLSDYFEVSPQFMKQCVQCYIMQE